jgi:hypothetical protein
LQWVQHLYEELGSRSSAENKVDDLWTAICTWQFPITEDYLIRVRDRLITSKPGSPDITIEKLQNGKPSIIIIMENKRASCTTRTSSWTKANTELVNYLDIELERKGPSPEFQIGLVAIGRYVRFYRREVTNDKGEEIEDYPGTGGKAYQIKDDRVEVQDILSRIKEEKKN